MRAFYRAARGREAGNKKAPRETHEAFWERL